MPSIKGVVWFFLYSISRAGCILKLPLLTAISWRLSLVNLPDIRKSSTPRGRVIVLNKIGGTDDLAAAYRNKESEFNFYLLRRKQVSLVFEFYLQSRVTHYNYISDDPEIEADKQAYRNYLKKVLRCLSKLWHFNAVTSFNIAYAAEREFAAALREIGIPFIVCHKECVKTKAQHQVYSTAYRELVGPYSGTGICVYNEEERDAMLRANLASSDQVSVVGCARIDLTHEMRKLPKVPGADKTILYYTVFEQAGLPYLDKKWFAKGQTWQDDPPLHWHELARMTGECLVELAREVSELQVIFKAKQGNENNSRSQLPDELPPNVTFIGGGTGHALLQQADVVVAFNSASVLESIAAGKSVVVPMFGIDAIPDADLFVYDLADVAKFAHSAAEFKSILRQLIRERPGSRPLSEAASRVLNRYVGNSDGKAGLRLRQYIETTIFTSLAETKDSQLSHSKYHRGV